MSPETREHIVIAATKLEKDLFSFVGDFLNEAVLEEIRQLIICYLRRVQQVAPIDFDPALVGVVATYTPYEKIPAWISRECRHPNHIEANAYTRRLFEEIEGNFLQA